MAWSEGTQYKGFWLNGFQVGDLKNPPEEFLLMRNKF
jgi:hypothetical protein